MPHPRWLAWTGIALGALAPLGCVTNGQEGDPGAAFSSGSGTYPTTAGDGQGGGRRATGGADGGASASDAGVTGDARPRAAACTASATATFSLAWSLETATGTDSTCDGVGGATVDVDVVNLKTGAATSASIPCASLAATTCAMPAGRYSISMKLRDASGALLSEVLAPLMFLADGQNTAVTSLPLQVGGVDAGKARGFALTWSIDQVDTHAIQSCGEAGASTVRLLAGATKFDLPCADGKGRTTAVAPGSYAVTLGLLDASGATLSGTQSMNIAVAAGQLVFLGDVPFDVN